jgi:hypothetical protein
MTRVRLLPAALIGLGLAVSPHPALGAVTFTSSVTPDSVKADRNLEYRLTMVNDGELSERFGVRLEPPSYHPKHAEDGIGEGESVVPLDLPTIEGPATVIDGLFSRSVADLASCSATGAGNHGDGFHTIGFAIDLPPHSTSTLHAPFRTSDPLWPDLDLRLRFAIGTTLLTGLPGTLTSPRTIISPQPQVAGPVGVHITFRTRPRSGRGGFGEIPSIPSGRRITIAGHTNPAIPGQRVDLRYARISTSGRITERGRAARPRVRAKGRFRAHWVPPHSGRYELWAVYKRQRAGLVSDDTCPRLLRVRRP